MLANGSIYNFNTGRLIYFINCLIEFILILQYEYKMKRLKKQKVYVFISQEGVKTSRRLKTKRVRNVCFIFYKITLKPLYNGPLGGNEKCILQKKPGIHTIPVAIASTS